MGGGSIGPGDHTSWSSADLDSNSFVIRSYGYLGSIEPSKVNLEKAHYVNDDAMISEIDSVLRRHTDKLLQAIDGLSTRLLQLESRTRQLELSVDDLKVSVGDNHGNTDEKMRQTENILLEVQSCMQDLKYKQEYMNAQVQPKMLLMSKLIETQETQNIAQKTTPASQQFNQQFSVTSLQQFPISISPSPPQQSIYPSIQLPTQFPPTPTSAVPQLDTYFPPASHTQEAPSQQFPLPPAQHQQMHTLPPPSGIVEHDHFFDFFQLTPSSLYTHQQPVAADDSSLSQLQPPIPHHPEESHIASQTYPPSFQQVNSLYDSRVGNVGRSTSGLSSSIYSQPSGPSELHSYSGPSSNYGNDQPYYTSDTGGNNYPQIPTARILPQAIPMASTASGGTGSGGSGNRIPMDGVVDKVAEMGFSRDGVRETVHKLMENGQAVDLNVVLDKLMTDGEVQPPRDWFGR